MPVRSLLARIFLPVLLMLVAPGVGVGHAHPGHVRPGGLYLALKVEAEQIRGGLNLPEAVVRQLVSPPIDLGRPPSVEDQIRLRDAALAVLRATPLAVDGQAADQVVDRVDAIVRVPPVALRGVPAVDGLHVNPGPYPALQVRFHLNAKEPRRLGARWTRPDLLGGEDPAVGATVVVGEQAEPFHLSAQEPSFEWHAPFRGQKPAVALAPAQRRPAFPWELLATHLLLFGLLFWRARSLARRGLVAVLAVATAVGAGWVWWQRPLGRPDDHTARIIHGKLLRDAYAAFEQADDAAAYDALARVVDGPLLEWLYAQLHEGLVLREEGGAVARVTAVDVLEAKILGPPSLDARDEAFQVDARWQVVGEVRHYGHTHRRTQRYTGTFTLAPRGSQWRIVDLALGDQERVDTQPAEGLLNGPTTP